MKGFKIAALLALGSALLCGAEASAADASPKKEAAPMIRSDALPPFLKKAAKRWKVDEKNVVISVVPLENVNDIDGRIDASKAVPALSFNADRVVEPASTAKLITTLAALETLGARFRWFTEFYFSSEIGDDGVLNGPLYIRGGGDPSLVIENLLMQIEKLRQMGLKHINGDVVLDRSYFSLPDEDPSAFDGRGSRPYNVGPDALLINYRNVSFDFIPNEDGRTAKIISIPKMDGVKFPSEIALNPKGGCGDWKRAIGFKKTRTKDGGVVLSFKGRLPAACGAKNFNVIPFSADEYFSRVFRAAWEDAGGTWSGKVASGRVPSGLEKSMVVVSKSLPEVVSLVNKWSNNTMARHLFLTMGRALVIDEAQKKLGKDEEIDYLSLRGAGIEDARAALHKWFESRGIDDSKVFIDNGSGLSRVSRTTADVMTKVLAAGWVGPYMPEYAASLPISGEDGTMAKRQVAVKYGRIKTGFLSDVRSIGGYIRSKSGRAYAVYASVHGKRNMPGGIAFLDNVINWVYMLDER